MMRCDLGLMNNMADIDIRALAKKPAALVIAGLAVVAGVFFAAKMRGGSKQSNNDEPPVTVINPRPVTDMADEEALAELRQQIARLSYPQTPPPDNGYPPPKPPVPPNKIPPQVPRQTPPGKLPPGIVKPVFTSISPITGKPMTTITITGQHLDLVTGMLLGGTDIAISAKSAVKMQVVIPASHHVGIYALTAVTAAGRMPIRNITVQPGPIPVPPRPGPQPQPQPQRIPGDFPADCTGIGAKDPSNPRAYTPDAINRWVDAYIHQNHSDHIAWQRALNMAYAGTTGKANLRSVRYDYLSRGAAWLNGVRRKNGLRAMTQATFDQLVTDCDAEIARNGSRNSFSKEFVYALFAKYHAPFVC